ncbi:hypothetical protein [Echinicola vietnamensis]|uniref:G8 domain-containing protein n=1 Tax=Echinicola vietnamensis (strain DSM 17526 / LMG 23754 / KMM 6221) TaxID=926556 RepID=L0FVM4_ECHVK|nr:hypothetical protein [Echinicola vietnamensis]AGA77058.1 hypothetical protein Echvi_0783 [Echinicola vietnamensis DSM 17526]
MKYKRHYLLSIVLFVVFSPQHVAFGQQDTYVPNNPGCNGQWIDGDCWDVTNPDPTCTVINAYPPGAGSCHTEIIINDDLTRITSLTISGSTDIYINNGATLTFGNNLTINDGHPLNVFIEEPSSSINIVSTLTVSDQATFSISGDPDRLPSDPITNYAHIGDVEIDGAGTIAIDENAGVDIEGVLDIHNPSNEDDFFALIAVEGAFYTTSIIVRGNSHLEFEVAENSTVIASEPEGTLDMNGNSSMTFIGDYYDTDGDADGTSIVEVGGNMDTNGSGALITADDATIYTCYTFPDGIATSTDHEGQFFEGECGIVPVVWLEFSAEFDPSTGYVKLDWATAKEWESSHFEIERTHDSNEDFQKVGQLRATGWTDQPSTYHYRDKLDRLLSDKLYYRIKQVDFDESFSYTKVITVDLPLRTPNQWTAFPNPSAEQLFLRSPKNFFSTDSQVNVRVYAPATSANIGPVSIPHDEIIPLHTLLAKAPKGLLILEINWNDRTEHIKILHR